MSVEEIDRQTVRHDSGAVIGNVDRTQMYYELHERRVLLSVERDDTYAITLPAQPRWNDGTALSEPQIAALEQAVEQACRHWGIDVAFYRIDASRPGPGIDEIVDLIVQSRPDGPAQ